MNAPAPVPMLRSAALDRSRLKQRLRRVVQGAVLFDAATRGRYATDASIYQVEPIGVVVPADELDVAAAMELARELKVPVLPRGGGTSQCGQTVAQALVIDDSKHLQGDRVRSRGDDGRGAARRGARSAECLAEAAWTLVSGGRFDLGAGNAGRHGG